MKISNYFFGIGSIVLMTGCDLVRRNQSCANPISSDEAVVISNREAAKDGVDLSRFGRPEAHFEFTEKDCTWSVFYEGLSNVIGNHFLVIVDGRTGSATLSGGL